MEKKLILAHSLTAYCTWELPDSELPRHLGPVGGGVDEGLVPPHHLLGHHGVLGAGAVRRHQQPPHVHQGDLEVAVEVPGLVQDGQADGARDAAHVRVPHLATGYC